MSDRFEQALNDLVSIEADVDASAEHEGEEIFYSLCLTRIKRTTGNIQDGSYKAIILMLRQPVPVKDEE